ncbi:Telo-bind multi-domain protein [Pyrenophora teres f. maculata]|nr:Telo-bind multi-domain protein [Pyrenophora teres f. maculata]
MDQLHIPELNPELPGIETKHFRAKVTLIWPYSSSARQFALLLVEPDLRLRRKNGQVRARFSGSSAKAIATTGVGIGDEVVLSLQGAQFVQEGVVSTPGKSIDWELSYTHTVVAQVYRNGTATANLELVDVTPTPAPASPIRRVSSGAPGPVLQFESPAFLKRARLSNGPFFEAPYDPLAEDDDEEHDKKRRRKSFKNWKAWTYSARTPSPEKEDMTLDEELDSFLASPSRPAQLPRTPVSPSKFEVLSVAAGPIDTEEEQREPEKSTGNAVVTVDGQKGEETTAPPEAASRRTQDEAVRDADYFELYAGPDENMSSDAQYAFGGDTEVDTEVNTEEEGPTQDEPEGASMSNTDEDTERDESQLERTECILADIEWAADENRTGDDTEDLTVENTDLEMVEVHQSSVAALGPIPSSGAPRIVMPPPTLPNLQINVPTPMAAGPLTPIGKEPASPTLKPLAESTLPLPSPFPGGSDVNALSYFDHTIASEQPAQAEAQVEEEEDLPSEASYIGETSFFSSIGSSRASIFHPNHESAFTPVRFTFGIDGASLSRPVSRGPMQLSSPEPEAQPELSTSAPATIPETIADIAHAEESPVVIERAPSVYTTEDHAELAAATESQTTVVETVELEVIELSVDSEDEGDASDSKVDLVVSEQILQQSVTEQAGEDSDEADIAQSAKEVADGTQEGQHLEEGPSGSRQHSIIDLESPPMDSNIRSSTTQDQQEAVTSQDHDRNQDTMEIDNHSEFVNQDFATEISNVSGAPDEQAVTHTPLQDSETNIDDDTFGHAFEATDDYLQDAFSMDQMPRDQEDQQPAGMEHDLEIKVESIEEDSIMQPDDSNSHMAPLDRSNTPSASASALEEMEMSPVATAPARNTRSKAKMSASPVKAEAPTPKRTTRSTRSKATVNSLARSAISPARTRTRSAMSPSQDVMQTSPYSLRSHSNLQSPVNTLSFADTTASQQSPRKKNSRMSFGAMSDAGPSQIEDRDRFFSSYQPSQELGASQGRFSQVTYVKDSEEDESVRSEQSISTVIPSDDKAGTGAHEDYTVAEPSPRPLPMSRRRAGSSDVQEMAKIRNSSPAESNLSFNTQHLASSPARRLRSAGSTVATPSPRNVRRTRRQAYEASPEIQEDVSDQEVPETSQRLHKHASSGKSGGSKRSSQPDATDVDELIRDSPRADNSFAHNQQSSNRRKKPITPRETQQTATDSQLSSTDTPQGQNIMLTPQLTQATSAGLHSLQTDAETKDVASRSASPTLIDASSPPPTAETQPSIGLSTPLAYYTPLKDLVYFLNRSSQFHSAANPDILALVTSPSTPPEKAKKGPKHWTTTFHITDVSVWPATTTTVQCFRAYETALPEVQVGDVVLLRAFAVKSLNRQPMLCSADESAWCVWRWGKPVWGAKRGAFGELRAREEVKGPSVERGEGEWREVEKLRMWFLDRVQRELREKEENGRKTRSRDKAVGKTEA